MACNRLFHSSQRVSEDEVMMGDDKLDAFARSNEEEAFCTNENQFKVTPTPHQYIRLQSATRTRTINCKMTHRPDFPDFGLCFLCPIDDTARDFGVNLEFIDCHLHSCKNVSRPYIKQWEVYKS